MTNEEWNRLEQQYEKDVVAIEIPEWPTEAQVKNISAKIDKVYTKAVFLHGRVKTEDENVDRWLDKTIKLNGKGKNESERKRNSIEAAMSYRTRDGTIVDLFELQEQIRQRRLFMESVLKALEGKVRSLTLSYGALKIEASLGK